IAKGKEEGLAEGLAIGKEKGKEEGLAEGLEIGKKESEIKTKNIVINLYQQNQMTAEQIAKIVNENIETIKQWLNLESLKS
ncbi:MAG: hypothetical protein ACI4V7_07750, partial [Succinivibrionaceae bacterium]